jgi:ketosteroid isomerase-like protein
MSTATLTDNATRVAKIYEAFKNGDIPYILDNLADDCKFITPGEGYLPHGGTYTGKEISDFFKKLNEAEEFNEFNPVSIRSLDENEVVSFGNMKSTSRKTGKKANSDWAMHWKFNEEGKAVYCHNYFDTVAAYAASL